MATRSSARLLNGIPAALRMVAAAGVLLAALAIGLILAFQVAYAGRVYPGVVVLGLDLSGRTAEEAQALLESRFALYAQTPLTLRQGVRTWQLPPAALGLGLDGVATVRESYLVGRQGSLGRLTEQVSTLRFGERLEPTLTFDEARAAAALARVHEDIRTSPASAGLVVGADGSVVVTPSRQGLELDLARAVAAVRATTLALASREIELPTVPVPVALSEAELAAARDRALAIVGRPLTLTAAGRSWVLSSQELAQLLVVTQQPGRVAVGIDEARLTAHLERIAREAARPAVDAQLRLVGQRPEVVPGADGQELDVPSSRTMALARIGQDASIPLVLRSVPGLRAEALADLRARLEIMLSGPTMLTFEGRSWALPAAELAAMLAVRPGRSGSLPTVELDGAKLTPFVKAIAKQVDREPKDARFRIQGERVTVVTESVDGAQVDVPATVAAALPGLLAHPGTPLPLVAKLTRPEVPSEAASAIVLRDLIMDASTSFAGSIPAKMHNIQLAASRLNGTVVPPGGTFSFNRALGPATLASGFQLGYGIMLNSDGQAETVPSEAGGICQVATTLFQAVFWAGYPMVERNWHMYWIAKYGTPPRGLQGLDATVDDGYGVDFRFKNNTANWIAVEASTSGTNLRFALWGIKPTWTVRVGKPKITKVVPANRELVRQDDPTMPLGQTLIVEAPEDGFEAEIERVVVRGEGASEEVVDRWIARSSYRPSRYVMLVGTKGATPTPTGTVTPPAASTPTPTATPTKPAG